MYTLKELKDRKIIVVSSTLLFGFWFSSGRHRDLFLLKVARACFPTKNIEILTYKFDPQCSKSSSKLEPTHSTRVLDIQLLAINGRLKAQIFNY